MKRTGMLVAAVAVLAASAGGARGNEFTYPDFGDTSSLTLNGQAHVTTPDFSPVVRLVSAGSIYGGGSVFHNEAHELSYFQTSFCFHISELGGITNDLNPDSGADGLAFVLQPLGPNFIEHTGGGMGYEGEPKTVAIEFDCWDNGPAYTEPSRSHVGVMVDGIIDHAYAVATADVGDMAVGGHPEIDSPVFWWTTITYQEGLLSVDMRYNPPHGEVSHVFSDVAIDIPAILDSYTGWVGFTAGTGLAHAHHDLCNWSFIPEPAALSLLAAGGLALVRRRR